MVSVRFLVAILLAASGSAALAHGAHAGSGFSAGFAHPFSGADHLLAMLAVGIYAARQGAFQRWAVPAGFVAAMLGGAALAAAGVVVPMVEAGVAASVLILGLMIAFALRLPRAMVLPLVAVLAVFHGQAHQAELGGGGLLGAAAGFALATALLHGAGAVLALWQPQSRLAQRAHRASGLALAGVGAVMLGA